MKIDHWRKLEPASHLDKLSGLKKYKCPRYVITFQKQLFTSLINFNSFFGPARRDAETPSLLPQPSLLLTLPLSPSHLPRSRMRTHFHAIAPARSFPRALVVATNPTLPSERSPRGAGAASLSICACSTGGGWCKTFGVVARRIPAPTMTLLTMSSASSSRPPPPKPARPPPPPLQDPPPQQPRPPAHECCCTAPATELGIGPGRSVPYMPEIK